MRHFPTETKLGCGMLVSIWQKGFTVYGKLINTCDKYYSKCKNSS